MKPQFCAVVLAVAAPPALALAEMAPPAMPMEDILVSASRIVLDLREVGSAVSVITDLEMKERQITFIKDSLQDLPGIQVTTDRPGDYTGVSIRGSDNDHVLFLIDGIKLGDPSSTSTQFQAEHLTSRDVARIEVLRGNQSSLYGSDAIGGVINIITQRATEDGLKVNLEGEYGSHDTLNGGASLLGKSGPLDFRVTASGYRHDGPSLADPIHGAAVEDDEYWRYGLSGRVGYQAGANVELQAIGFWQDSFSDLDDTGADSENTVRKEEYAVAGMGSFSSDDGRLNGRLSASRYVAERLYFGQFYAPDGDSYKGTKDNLNINLNYRLSEMLSLSAGGEYEEEKTDQTTFYTGNFLADINTRSVFGEMALQPTADLTLTGAVRLDDNSRFGAFDTYRATAAYLIDSAPEYGAFKLRASYGTGAKAPGLYQLFDPVYGNEDLRVESSKGGDIGIDWSYARLATVQLSYFYARTRDEIVWDAGIGAAGGYTQYGRTRKHGVEFALNFQPTRWLNVQQSYTWLNAEEDGDEDGLYLDMGRPKHSGSTSVAIMPDDALTLTTRARYRSRNAASYGGVTAGYVVFDLLASYRLTERLELYGRVVNLFDKQYQVSWGKNSLGLSGYGGFRMSF